MSTNLTAQAVGLAPRERIEVEPRTKSTVSGGQKAVIAGVIGVTLLGVTAIGRLQAGITSRDAEILLLNQTRFDVETRLHDVEYRLRVLWIDVRVAEEKAREAGKSS